MVPKTCSIPECERRSEKRGWCNMHYKRWLRHGSTEYTSRYFDAADAIANKTQRRGECLVWTGSLTPKGYVRIRDDGTKTMAHRLVYEAAHGKIPEGKEVDHICRNRACLELTHLRAVTRKQNGENKSGPYSTNRSGARGVTWDKKSQRWMVRVIHHQQRHYGGSFTNLNEADEAAIALRNKLFTHNELDREHAARLAIQSVAA